VLLLHRHLLPRGGGACVGAWAVEALRQRARLTVISWEPIDYSGVNRNFGTCLEPGQFETHHVPPLLRSVVDRLPAAAVQLRLALMLRRARQLDCERRFDVLLCTDDQVDFGRPGIQYVHYPWPWLLEHRERPSVYRWLCQRIAPASSAGVRRNATVANSKFVAQILADRYGIASAVVYPPVPADLAVTPWAERENAVIAISRFHPFKRLLEIIEIIARVRQRQPLQLTLIGTPDDQTYERAVRQAAKRHGEWVRLRTNLSREELDQAIATHRYGIHAAVEEHFGIAIAQMLRGGCIPFVHATGGPTEIIGDMPGLRFGSDDQAVERIVAVAGDAARQLEIREQLAQRLDLFSTERFMEELRSCVLG